MTAVEWFANQLGIASGSMLEQAKKMEKQLCKKVWEDAYKAAKEDIVSDHQSTFEHFWLNLQNGGGEIP